MSQWLLWFTGVALVTAGVLNKTEGAIWLAILAFVIGFVIEFYERKLS